MSETLNVDFSQLVRVDTNQMEWQASPSATVWRKRLDLAGESEASRVTSVVRYDAGSDFHSHPHPDGEEIYVLDGVFEDEHGSYPAGTYLLNPGGHEHAPRSSEGCVLFVKLRQYPGERQQLTVDTSKGEWVDARGPGIKVQFLYKEEGHAEKVWLARFAPGAEAHKHDHPGGEEIYVIEGAIEDENGVHEAGTWIRFPDGSSHTPRSKDGALIYVKAGHLPTA